MVKTNEDSIKENPEYIYFKNQVDNSNHIQNFSLYDVEEMYKGYKNSVLQAKKIINQRIDSDRKVLRIVDKQDAEVFIKSYNNLVKKRDNINEFIN